MKNKQNSIYFFLIVISLLLLSGCKSSEKNLNLYEFDNVFFDINKELIYLENHGEFTLPENLKGINTYPFYIFENKIYFLSSRYNKIFSFNPINKDIKTFYAPTMDISAFCVNEDGIFFNDRSRGKILKMSPFDMKNYINFLGQINEDSYKNGFHIVYDNGVIFQYNYDFPLIKGYYTDNKKLVCNININTQKLENIFFRNNTIFLVFKDKIKVYSRNGKIINELPIKNSTVLFTNNGFFIAQEDEVTFYNFNLKSKYKLILRGANIKKIKKSDFPLFYYLSNNRIYHILENKKSERIPIKLRHKIIDFVKSYDNNILVILNNNDIFLYNKNGTLEKKFKLELKYYDIYIFSDNNKNYFIADIDLQMVKVISEASVNIIKSIIYHSAAFENDSNIITDEAGNIYFVNKTSGCIEKITPKFVNEQFPSFKIYNRLPYKTFSQILTDNEKNIYLINKNKRIVIKYNKNAEFIYQLGPFKDNNIDFFRKNAIFTTSPFSELIICEDLKKPILDYFSPSAEFIKREELPINNIINLSIDKKNRLWVNSINGLYVITQFKNIIHFKNISNILSFSIFNNDLWTLQKRNNNYFLTHYNIVSAVNMGIKAYKNHKYKEAYGFFKKCLEIDSKNHIIKFYLANCYTKLGRYKEAYDLLKDNKNIKNKQLKKVWNELLKMLEELI